MRNDGRRFKVWYTQNQLMQKEIAVQLGVVIRTVQRLEGRRHWRLADRLACAAIDNKLQVNKRAGWTHIDLLAFAAVKNGLIDWDFPED
jgi:hypothetical protein